jgi:hypothetical protein
MKAIAFRILALGVMVALTGSCLVGSSIAAVTCPVCKTCSYTFQVGPFTITESMGGKGEAEVDDFQHPGIPRRQTWTTVSMQGTTPFGNVSVNLDQSRVSEGEIVSQGIDEFPAANTTRFFFIMSMDTPMGPMDLTSDDPVTLFAAFINAIPPTATYGLVSPVDFYEVGDSLKVTVGTLLASSVSVMDGSGAVGAQLETGAAPVALGQNRPNPVHPETVIEYAIDAPGHVTLRIFDLRGAVVRTLVDAPMPAGPHAVRWNGRDDAVRLVTAGVYFYELQASGHRETRRMIVLR